jgi:hypothetical protein
MKVEKEIIGKEITEKEIQEIERLTGGKIGTHTFGPNDEHKLENSFLSPNGDYIGDFNLGKWYIKNKLMVDEMYPHGVAAVIQEDTYGTENPIIEGMFGYTHRGGQLFKIGDRLFDEGHEPKKEDYTKDEWEIFESDFKRTYEESDELEKKWIEEDGISYVIPFKKRGVRIIETMEDAFQAAKNMSKYLS